MLAYHDEEWGVPARDARTLFEFLAVAGARAGLTWMTIQRRRDGYRRAFASFDPGAVAGFTTADVERLLADPSIVRNRAKIVSTIENARALLAIQAERGSFAALLWSFVDGEPLQPSRRSLSELPSETPIARAISKDLRGRGLRVVGPTIAYALMEACGLVNHHQTKRFRWRERGGGQPGLPKPAKEG